MLSDGDAAELAPWKFVPAKGLGVEMNGDGVGNGDKGGSSPSSWVPAVNLGVVGNGEAAAASQAGEGICDWVGTETSMGMKSDEVAESKVGPESLGVW